MTDVNVEVHEAVISAVAMAEGFGLRDRLDELHAACTARGEGAIELYQLIGQCAHLSARTLSAIDAVPGFEVSGLWAYEVDNVFGAAARARFVKEPEFGFDQARELFGSIVYEVLLMRGSVPDEVLAQVEAVTQVKRAVVVLEQTEVEPALPF